MTDARLGGVALTLDVRGRRVLVVGGGPVAARRAGALVAAGADVLVVAPEACEDLAAAERAGQLTWRRGEYTATDLDGAWLVHTATGNATVDDAVAADASAARVWCIHAGDVERGSARTPAIARPTADLLVAVSSVPGTPADPRRAAALRDAVTLAADTGALPLRRRRERERGGAVALVGGGPGDPGLITTRARRLLAEADVVVVDRLAPTALLDELDDDVVVVDVGKTAGHHPVSQQEINDLLVAHARAGRFVVRLKGGDPYVLGRGGEEREACLAAGVPVEVVPGVTSAVAVPAAVGIPVTHRGLSRGFTVVSGHDELAGVPVDPHHTLVLLMGVTRLDDTVHALVRGGRSPQTPVAVVEDGFGPRRRATVGTLATIARIAAERQVRAPAVTVVGEVVRLVDPAAC